jgi:hypothetical protein
MYHMNDLCLINVDSQEIFSSCQYHFDIMRILNSETYHRIYSLHLELQQGQARKASFEGTAQNRHRICVLRE